MMRYDNIYPYFLLTLSSISYVIQHQRKMQEPESDSEELREDENAAIKTYGFQDSVRNSQTSSGNLIPVDASDNECDNTYTRVNKSACKKSKVAKGKKIKNEVDHLLITN